MKEIWKDIKGYEGLYKISNWGVILSKFKNKNYIMKYHLFNGYPAVGLNKGGSQRKFRIHRLLALSFIKNDSKEAIHVAHLDGDKLNYNLNNLKWSTRSENESHKILHGKRNLGARHPMAKLSDNDVINIRKAYGSGETQRKLAEKYKMHQASISNIVLNKIWKHI